MPRGGRREKAGRKSSWLNPETQLIRVPKVLAGRLIEVAKHLDQGDDVQVVPVETKQHNLTETAQLSLSVFPSDQNGLEVPPQPLGLRALAKRLHVSSGTLSRHKKTTARSLAWMLEKDENWGWFYSPRDEKYHPVHPSEFDHLLDELNNAENYQVY